MLAVDHRPWARLLKLGEARYAWDVRHPVVSTRDDDGVEVLLPPVVGLPSRLPQRHLPLLTDLLYQLDSRVVLDQVGVAVPIQKSSDILPHHFPVTERRIRPMCRARHRTRGRRERLLAVLHWEELDVRLEVWVH